MPHRLVGPVAKPGSDQLRCQLFVDRHQLVEGLSQGGDVGAEALHQRGSGRRIELEPTIPRCLPNPIDGVALPQLLDRDALPVLLDAFRHRRRKNSRRDQDQHRAPPVESLEQ